MKIAQTKSLRSFHDVSPEARAAAFVSYCKESVKAVADGKLLVTDAAYNICGAVRYDEICAISQLDEVIELACALEMVRPRQDEKLTRGWVRISAAIEQLRA